MRAFAALIVGFGIAACGNGSHATQGSGETASRGGSSAGGTSAAQSTSNARATTDAASAAGDASAASSAFSAASGPRAQEAARFVAEGSVAFGHGDFPSAARSFRSAYELDSSPEMAFNVARVYERMGEVTEGIRFFEIVLRSNPDEARRADIERRIASLRAYEQRRREGIAQAPASSDELSAEGVRWFHSGVQLYRRHQYSQALLAFQQAYQYLQTPELFFNLASAHERLRHYDQAVEFLREYLQQRRGTPEEAEIQRHIDDLERRQ